MSTVAGPFACAVEPVLAVDEAVSKPVVLFSVSTDTVPVLPALKLATYATLAAVAPVSVRGSKKFPQPGITNTTAETNSITETCKRFIALDFILLIRRQCQLYARHPRSPVINRVITIILLLALPVFSQQAPPAIAPHVLQRDVQAHEEFLASDALQGRGSGTRDEWIAATYVAAQFRQFGLEPKPSRLLPLPARFCSAPVP